jgi:hypothetical protein
MSGISIWKDPKLKPMPASLAPAMRDAQLPLRVEAARRALAECVDLSELLDWKDRAAAIAAAAKAAKMPDIARDARRLQKEALLRLGQLLTQYTSNATESAGPTGGLKKSPRGSVAERHGISSSVRVVAVRLASLPKKAADKILADDRVLPSQTSMSRALPGGPGLSVGKRNINNIRRSNAYTLIMRGIDEFGRARGGGLHMTATAAKRVNPSDVRTLDADEKKLVRAKVTEIMELLDAIDEACK